ncbi:MAG: cytochrome c oxidase subunit II, partial [Rhodospirillaceae bacterium]|nr:cytochrome c oxidase subunit II [Rhodospirillaceae bacterium]
MLAAGSALADQPHPWEIGFQAAATPTMDRVTSLHHGVLIVIAAIVVFVLTLLLIVIVRFNERRNPQPSRNAHNTLVEVAWTVVPVMILLGIAIPSFRLLYFADRAHNPQMTIKAIGHQWNWSYEYPDNGDFTFEALIVDDADLKPGQPRLLETDNAVVVPVDTDVRLLTTSTDVIHSWAMPAFGVKMDAVPGRVNETWFRVEREGTYYGQCSELCGTGHGFMPIKIEAVSKEKFADWVKKAQQEFARAAGAPAGQVAPRGGPARPAPAGEPGHTNASGEGEDEQQRHAARRQPPWRSRRGARARSPRPSSHRLAAVRLFDEPQGHRHDVPD